MNRCFLAVSLLFLLWVPVRGHAEAPSGVDLQIWHGYRAAERTALEQAVAAYNKARAGSGVKATLRNIPSDAFTDKISAAVPRGVGPDVFIFPQDRLGGWVESGNIIEPLDFFLDEAIRKRFIPSTLEAMTYRGSVYALPLNFKVLTLIYNKKLLPKPPRTTQEMVEGCAKRPGKREDTACLVYPYTDFYYHAALMNAFGGRVFDPGPTPRLDAPENVKALELLMRWVDKDRLLPPEPSTALTTSLFNAGKAAMVFSGPWFLGEVSPQIDYGLALLPTVTEAGGQPMRPWMTVEGVAVAAPSKHKEQAFDFVNFLTGPEGERLMALVGRQNPALQQSYDEPAIAQDPVLKAFRAQAEFAVPLPNLAEMTMVWSPMTSAMNAIARKASPPKAALQEAQKTVQRDVEGLRRKRSPAP
ncbi:sugar ABC transporter substrate-binding protein [Stigmatella aurantiaca]|uniref:Cyclomaltodextrin binding protein, putative n=1 Tax=Stigmatella aurantiaca (strain DW4/3-1) TaxID=378806 RepID=Q094Z3_STIAD|nr:extracellular solute-binding protein [Stigmatella aurantiaca]ADO71329.1 Maltose binding protein [Stigmatella aurantiaca DW4/3-1]EAU67291.1 cyclomaltodextrin binding protein, putative [Stigmatella aurantiaca DW4/3-1]